MNKQVNFVLGSLCCVLETTCCLSSYPGQGLLSQSALQLNNQDSYAAAGYHNSQGLESVTGRHGQVGGAVHIYNQVNVCGSNRMTSSSWVYSWVRMPAEEMLVLGKKFQPGIPSNCELV